MKYTVQYESRPYGSIGVFRPMNWKVDADDLRDAIGKAIPVAHAAKHELRNPIAASLLGFPLQKLTPSMIGQ